MTDRSVLFLHPSDEAYGADRVLLQMAMGLRNRGWRVRVLLSDDQPPGWLSARLAEASIGSARGPLAPARRRYAAGRGAPGYFRALGRARRWVRSEATAFEPSVIHVNTSALLVAAVIGRPGRARVVWHVHEIVLRPRIASWLFRLVPRLSATRVIAISKAVRDYLSLPFIGAQNVTVVRNAIQDRPLIDGSTGHAPLVAFVGRINRWKGADVFADAVARVAPEFPDARFLLAGDPPPGEEWRRRALEDQLVRLGVADRVSTPGFVDDAPSLLDGASVVVVPSRWPEPFGLVTLEAMRAGKPVVATAHGAALELIDPGESGLLVPPDDAPALADAIARLLGSAELRARMGAAARRRFVEGFSEDGFIDGIESVYEEALGAR